MCGLLMTCKSVKALFVLLLLGRFYHAPQCCSQPYFALLLHCPKTFIITYPANFAPWFIFYTAIENIAKQDRLLLLSSSSVFSLFLLREFFFTLAVSILFVYVSLKCVIRQDHRYIETMEKLDFINFGRCSLYRKTHNCLKSSPLKKFITNFLYWLCIIEKKGTSCRNHQKYIWRKRERRKNNNENTPNNFSALEQCIYLERREKKKKIKKQKKIESRLMAIFSMLFAILLLKSNCFVKRVK